MLALAASNRARALKSSLTNPSLSETEKKNIQSQIDFIEGKKTTTSHAMDQEAMSSGLSFRGSSSVPLLLDPGYAPAEKKGDPKPGERDAKGNLKKPWVMNRSRGVPLAPFFDVLASSSVYPCNNFETLLLVSRPFRGEKRRMFVTPESLIYNTMWGDAVVRQGWVSKAGIELNTYISDSGNVGLSIGHNQKNFIPIPKSSHDARDIWELVSVHRNPTHLYPVKNLPTQDDAQRYYDANMVEVDENATEDDENSAGKINTKAMDVALRTVCRNTVSIDHPLYPQLAERAGVMHPLFTTTGYQRITGEEVIQYPPVFGGNVTTEGPAENYNSPYITNATSLWTKNNKEKGWDEKTMPVSRCEFSQQVTFQRDGKVTENMVVNGTIWTEQLETLGVTNPKHVAAFLPQLLEFASPFIKGELGLTRSTGLVMNTDVGALWQDGVRCYGLSIKVYAMLVDWMQMICSGFFEVSQMFAIAILKRFLKVDLELDIDEDSLIANTDIIPANTTNPILKHIKFKMTHNCFSAITSGNIINVFESKATLETPKNEHGEHKQYRFFLLTNATLEDEKLLGQVRQLYSDFYLSQGREDYQELAERIKKMSFVISKHLQDALDGNESPFTLPSDHQYTLFQVKRDYADMGGNRPRNFEFLGSRPVMPPAADTDKKAEQTRKRIQLAARKPSEVLASLDLLTELDRVNIDTEAYISDTAAERIAASSEVVVPEGLLVPSSSAREDEYVDNAYSGMNISFGESSTSSAPAPTPVEDDEPTVDNEQPPTKPKPTKPKSTKTKKKVTDKRKRESEAATSTSTKTKKQK